MPKVQVTAPTVPGLPPTVQSTHETLEDARAAARKFANRRDLRWQDVRIETTAGRRIEYAGPNR